MADVTQDEIIKLVREYGAFKQMYGYGASPNERQNHHRNAEAKLEEIIAALTRPAPSPSDGELLHQFQLAGCRIAAESPVTEEATDEYCVLRDKVLARMRGAAVPDELMSALATLFHGYCRLEDGDQKFAMVVPPDWTWQGRHPSDCVKAWAVVCDTVYPAAPEVPR